MRRQNHAFVIALAIVLAAGLSACSDDDQPKASVKKKGPPAGQGKAPANPQIAPEAAGGGKLIRVNNTVVDVRPAGPFLRVDDAAGPVGIYAEPRWPGAEVLMRVNDGDQLTATCQVKGVRMTNGNDGLTEDNALQFDSTTWYGLKTPDGRTGFVADAWTARSRGLGLPKCA